MKLFQKILIGLFIIFTVAGTAQAVIMHDLDMDQQYRAFANPSTGGVFTHDDDDNWYLASVVNMGNGWGLTAAHVVEDRTAYGGYFGATVYPYDDSSLIVDSFIYPDWTGEIGQGHDLALIQFADPLNDVPFSTLSTNRPSIGDYITFSGFGSPGEIGIALEQDGYNRGWEGYITEFGYPRHLPDIYLVSKFERPIWPQSLPLGGLSTGGHSGGGVYDANGFLIAILMGTTNAGWFHYGSNTVATGLWEQEVQAWISDTIAANSVPAPGGFILLLSGILGLAINRRNNN